jgi:hypothetical protein
VARSLVTWMWRACGILQWDNASFAGIEGARRFAAYVASGDNRKKNYVAKRQSKKKKCVWDEV